MTEFKIQIGMSTNNVLANLHTCPKSTDKTRAKVLQFCQSDIDHKVTNDIELSMLNAWLNGDEKVPMPTKPVEKAWKPLPNNVYQKDDAIFIYDKDVEGKKPTTTTIYNSDDNFSEDVLIDYDNDGYADSRTLSFEGETLDDKNLTGEFKTTIEDIE